MADEENSESSEGEEQQESEDSGKTFTQSQVTSMMTKEKDQGRRQGRKEVLDALGFGTMDEAKAFSTTMKEAEAAQLSEVERAKREAEEARNAAQRDRDAAQAERFSAKLERALLTAGVVDAQVAKVGRLIAPEADWSDDEITAAVADLKADMPQLFTPGKQDTPPPNGDPGKAPGKKPDSDPSQRAKDRLKARHGERIKSNS